MQKTMKAAVIHNFEGIENIAIEEISTPMPQDNEVQIRIEYAGINPVDWKIADGLLTRLDYEFPITLGWDAAGLVSAVGKNVKNFKEKDAVFAYCRKEILHDGSFAEYICLDSKNIALKPEKLNFAESACVPLSALTAWQALYDTAKIKKNEKVLIHAGAGGVGSYALQLAKMKGAYVLTTASAANFEYVKSLGADEIIDYTQENLSDYIKKNHSEKLDVVLDTVGGNTLKVSYDLLKERGRLISIADFIDHAAASQKNLFAEFVFVAPNGEQLKKIAALFDRQEMQAPRIEEIPLEELSSALRKSREGHVQGKLVIKIS